MPVSVMKRAALRADASEGAARTWAALLTGIWQLRWNRQVPQKAQTEEFTWHELDHLNSPITIKKIEFIRLKRPKKNLPDPDGFTDKFYQMLKNEIMPILHNLSQTLGEGHMLPISLYDVVLS